jgi:hypothetical protein
MSATVDIWDPGAVKQAGIKALAEALGPVGMARFLQLIRKGRGDYSTDRDLWLKDQDMDSVVRRIKGRRQPAPATPAEG